MSATPGLPSAPDRPISAVAPAAGLQWWARLLLFAGFGGGVVALHGVLGFPPLLATLAAAVMWLVMRASVSRHDDPPAPTAPTRLTADRPYVRPEPERRIHVLADRCETCGRALTNPESRRARVGSECVKTHGPRYRYAANPDHARWADEITHAHVEQVARQAELDQQHKAALVVHAAHMEQWEAEMATPEASARRAARARATRRRSVVGILFWAAFASQWISF